MGFKVWGSGSGFGVWDLGFRGQGVSGTVLWTGGTRDQKHFVLEMSEGDGAEVRLTRCRDPQNRHRHRYGHRHTHRQTQTQTQRDTEMGEAARHLSYRFLEEPKG